MSPTRKAAQSSQVEQVRYNTRKHQTLEGEDRPEVQSNHQVENMVGPDSCNCDEEQKSCKISLTQTKNSRIFSQKMITLVLVSYLISSQSLTNPLNLSGKLNLSDSIGKTDQPVELTTARSLIIMAEAGPAPAPSRSATSASHRVPPINGSIFGKRSLNGANMPRRKSVNGASLRDEDTSRQVNYNDIITTIIEDFMAQNDESRTRAE